MDRDSFCVFPFNTLELRTSGHFTPCCKWNEHIRYHHKDEEFHVEKNSIQEIFQSDYLNNLRQGFLNGKKFEQCSECYMQEKSGVESLRQQGLRFYNVEWELKRYLITQSPSRLELKLGNRCNLSCRICDPYNSSQWVRELLARNLIDSNQFANFISGKLFKRSEAKLEFKSILPHLTELHFFGGEPLIEDEHFEILELAVELGCAKNIILNYNTNGTVYNKQLMDLWGHFKSIQVNFSIDDIDQRFEYQRFGAKWATILHNLQKFKAFKENNLEIADFKLFITLSLFNLYYLDDYVKFFNNFLDITFSILHNPSCYNIKSIPAKLKVEITNKLAAYTGDDRLKPILDYMNESDHYDKYRDEIKNRITGSDDYRGQSFASIFPEISPFFY